MMSFSHRVGGMVYSSLEGMQMQTQSPNLLLHSRFRHGSGQCWRPEMRKSLLSLLDLLEGSSWFMMPLEAMLVLVVHAVAPGHDEA